MAPRWWFIYNSFQQFLDLTGAFKAIASEAGLAPALEGSPSVQTVSMLAALVGATCTLIMVWNWKKPICTFSFRIGNRYYPSEETGIPYLHSHICRLRISDRSPPGTCRGSCRRCWHTVCCRDRGSSQLHIHQYLKGEKTRANSKVYMFH